MDLPYRGQLRRESYKKMPLNLENVKFFGVSGRPELRKIAIKMYCSMLDNLQIVIYNYGF